MAVIILIVRDGLVYANIVDLQTFLGVFAQLILAGALGLVGYLAMSLILKSPELAMIKKLFTRTPKNGVSIDNNY